MASLLEGKPAYYGLIIGLVLLFPLSTDPLRKIPASRLALWPLERSERWLLRAASPWINPLTWPIAALAIWLSDLLPWCRKQSCPPQDRAGL